MKFIYYGIMFSNWVVYEDVLLVNKDKVKKLPPDKIICILSISNHKVTTVLFEIQTCHFICAWNETIKFQEQCMVCICTYYFYYMLNFLIFWQKRTPIDWLLKILTYGKFQEDVNRSLMSLKISIEIMHGSGSDVVVTKIPNLLWQMWWPHTNHAICTVNNYSTNNWSSLDNSPIAW